MKRLLLLCALALTGCDITAPPRDTGQWTSTVQGVQITWRATAPGDVRASLMPDWRRTMRKLTLLALSILSLTLAACAPAAVPMPQPAPTTPAPTGPGTLLPKATLTLTPYAPLVLTPGTLADGGVTLGIQLVNPAQVVMVRISEAGSYPPAVGGSAGQRVLLTGLAFGPLRPDTVFEASLDGLIWVTVARYACPATACR